MKKLKEDNSVRVKAVLDLRKSGAAGTHADRRTKRNRTRQTQRADAIEEQR